MSKIKIHADKLDLLAIFYY